MPAPAYLAQTGPLPLTTDWLDSDGKVLPGNLPPGTVPLVYNQATPSDTWTIVHNFGYYPSWVTVDGAGNTFMMSGEHLDANTLVLHSTIPINGTATIF